ncbi:YhfG family protein [Photobacterium sp. CCB-ST2H9]|uniref:YhfG family protein n=1 Tax=Photobacterium sp. CCB-ST2H9 TaxID=2912855 RepID=UPI00200552E0|nr:YhfG family protein [Photobacterium sp. CCB-ST2H9]UTM60111.1 YhfG family protein [Photobacterium sp. CCB-ST2H9]
MLTTKVKAERFRAMRRRNYRASLKLEGFELDALSVTEQASEVTLTEEALIAKLKKAYAR